MIPVWVWYVVIAVLVIGRIVYDRNEAKKIFQSNKVEEIKKEEE